MTVHVNGFESLASLMALLHIHYATIRMQRGEQKFKKWNVG